MDSRYRHENHGHIPVPKAGITPDLLLIYALSHNITVAIVGCSSTDEVRCLAVAGRNPAPLSRDEREEIMALFRPHAYVIAFYRVS